MRADKTSPRLCFGIEDTANIVRPSSTIPVNNTRIFHLTRIKRHTGQQHKKIPTSCASIMRHTGQQRNKAST